MSGAVELRWVVVFCGIWWIGRLVMRLVSKRARKVIFEDIFVNLIVAFLLDLKVVAW